MTGWIDAIDIGCVVEIGLYSGRPDPRFALDRHDVDELQRRLRVLPATSVLPREEGLGYRGLSLLCPAAPLVTIAFGQVTRDGVALADPGRVAERWLLDRATGRVADDTLAYARAQFAP